MHKTLYLPLEIKLKIHPGVADQLYTLLTTPILMAYSACDVCSLF